MKIFLALVINLVISAACSAEVELPAGSELQVRLLTGVHASLCSRPYPIVMKVIESSVVLPSELEVRVVGAAIGRCDETVEIEAKWIYVKGAGSKSAEIPIAGSVILQNPQGELMDPMRKLPDGKCIPCDPTESIPADWRQLPLPSSRKGMNVPLQPFVQILSGAEGKLTIKENLRLPLPVPDNQFRAPQSAN